MQNLNEEQIRDRLRDIEYQTAVYNQPSNSQNAPNTAFQNVIKRGNTFMA